MVWQRQAVYLVKMSQSLIQLMVTLQVYLFIIKTMLSKHMFSNITPLFL